MQNDMQIQIHNSMHRKRQNFMQIQKISRVQRFFSLPNTNTKFYSNTNTTFSANTNTICYADLHTISCKIITKIQNCMQMYTQIHTHNCTQYTRKIVGKCTHKIVLEKQILIL